MELYCIATAGLFPAAQLHRMPRKALVYVSYWEIQWRKYIQTLPGDTGVLPRAPLRGQSGCSSKRSHDHLPLADAGRPTSLEGVTLKSAFTPDSVRREDELPWSKASAWHHIPCGRLQDLTTYLLPIHRALNLSLREKKKRKKKILIFGRCVTNRAFTIVWEDC